MIKRAKGNQGSQPGQLQYKRRAQRSRNLLKSEGLFFCSKDKKGISKVSNMLRVSGTLQSTPGLKDSCAAADSSPEAGCWSIYPWHRSNPQEPEMPGTLTRGDGRNAHGARRALEGWWRAPCHGSMLLQLESLYLEGPNYPPTSPATPLGFPST